jgi:hypothetical protein
MRAGYIEAWRERSKPPMQRRHAGSTSTIYLGEGSPDTEPIHIRFDWEPSSHVRAWFRTSREAFAYRKKLRREGYCVRAVKG